MGNLTKIILFINYNDRLLECVLPGVNDRKVKLNLFEQTGISNMELDLEIWDGKWYIRSNGAVRISRDHNVVEEAELLPGSIFHGKIYESGIRFQIRAAELGKEQTGFIKYELRGRTQVELGQDKSCQIILQEGHVSRYHAVLFCRGSQWYIEDRSKNGTFLNGKKVNGVQPLSYGDSIAIMDYQILFLESILAINCPGRMSSRLNFWEKGKNTQNNPKPKREWFFRAPRFMEPLDTEEVEIEAPPTLNKSKKMPAYLTLGPSLTMPIPILLMVLFNVAVSRSTGNGSTPITYFGMAISVIMFAALGVMWAVLRRNHEETAEIEQTQEREGAYLNYIAQNEQLLSQKEQFNKRVLDNLYYSSETILKLLRKDVTSLWNRNVNHDDFLMIRIGTGPMKLPNAIKVPKQRFSIQNDPLMSLPRQVMEKHEMIGQTPKLLDLGGHRIIGVAGEERFLFDISNSMIVQTAALHSYQDIRMAFLIQPGAWEKEWRWVKWLPHAFDSEKKIRLIANSEESWERVQQVLLKEIKQREEAEAENRRKGNSVPKQHYLVFVTHRERFNNSLLYQYMISDHDIGFTFILLYGYLSLMPNECRYIVENTRAFQGVYSLNETIGRGNMVQFEGISCYKAEPFARMLNRYVLQETGQGGLPESIDYLSMIGIGKVEQWDLLKHYKENRSYEGIRAWLGIMAGDRPMYLDIHEKKYGPHGLIAGTTGSGKSELIQTFILSLALNYHPSEVAFILIDYKGGGMAKIFEGMPHVAGMILNLNEEGEDGGVDRNQTRRTLLSIRSELKRREKIFNRFRVNHIDDYMRLYREGKAAEPLPHLIIISDEFAELKKEQPDFIKELVSTARVGRSIGVHLILATQKPAGVVDDQITSNSRFKICLRVQDRTDSNEMLKRPEAAYLSTTGRAYFQLGNNELFELFQSGYSGADYEPKEQASSADDEDVTMIGIDGTPLVQKKKRKEKDSSVISQIDACIAYIKKIAKENHIQNARPLWLPPLPKSLALESLEIGRMTKEIGSVIAAVGLLDDPERQQQYPFVLDFSAFSNLMILGNQGCGKSTLLQTILYGLATRYREDTVNFYIFDFSSGLLKNFEILPHCGKVALNEEEEAVKRTIKYLLKTMEERSQIFKTAGVGSFWEYKKVSKEKLPLIVFVIDNYFAFSESYENLEADLITILRGGQRTGIQTVISANRMNDMKFRLRQNFTKVIPLQLNEKMDYTEALGGCLDGFSASAKGRGLCCLDEIYEFQTALAVNRDTEFERLKVLTKEFRKIAADSKDSAVKIRVLPENETYEEFLQHFSKEELREAIPLGYEQEQIRPYRVKWDTTFCYLISGVSEEGIENVRNNFISYFGKTGALVYYVNLLPEEPKGNFEVVYKTDEDIFRLLLLLKEQFTARNKWRKNNEPGQDKKQFFEEFEPMYIMIDDFGAFLELIYRSHGTESYFPITELFFKEGKGLGIYFIAGMEIGKSASAPYTLAYKNFTALPKGIHLGGQLNMQKLFQFKLPVSQQSKRMADNIGCLMEDGKPYSIFIPWNKRKDSETESWTS